MLLFSIQSKIERNMRAVIYLWYDSRLYIILYSPHTFVRFHCFLRKIVIVYNNYLTMYCACITLCMRHVHGRRDESRKCNIPQNI